MINSIKKWLTKKTKTKVNPNIRISRLSTVGDPFLDEDIGMLDKEQIKAEGFIDFINEKKCEIRYGRSNYREKILLASLAGFLLGFCFFIDDFITSWKANEKFHLRIVSSIKERYGEDFYLNPKLPDNDKVYEYISNAKHISFPQYFYIHYTDSGFYNKSRVRNWLLLDGGFFLFSITMILIHLWVFSLLRKISPLVIDREKQLFYSWRRGKMYVARYSQVDIVNLHDILYLRVYGFDKNNKLMIYDFELEIPHLPDDIVSKKYLLAFMAKYLIKGKGSVSSVDFERRPHLFPLCKNPKPADWEAQITAILAELDRLGPPKGATDPK
ncbi:hypothetical protein Xbed_00582 [Xenorhabdus beddingii]|uniref:Uncharacterized protein n=1 Tax=Xenorhabdus beddingii TaxID=40578 RepID=A0A1Y2SQS4_9GAMM|nr:hypothetical protein [Xenorhabdus beddingii]OTA21353.1 hypothetical protein Xbed_00582 [Xenorhabdus beddingii]